MRTALRYGLCCSIVATLLLSFGCAKQTAKPGPVASPAAPPAAGAGATGGQPATDFTFTTVGGAKIGLAGLKGKPVLVNFWASWCGYCAQEAPDLEALYQKYHPQGLEMLGIGTDDAAALQSKAKELGLTYPIGSGPDIAKTYGVSGVPHTFIVDRQGKISASLLGARPKDELEAAIKKVM